jgi:hypothetical protein
VHHKIVGSYREEVHGKRIERKINDRTPKGRCPEDLSFTNLFHNSSELRNFIQC